MARVLVVEDYDIVRTTLSEAIELAGHTVESVASKHEAEALLSPGSHDLVICNVKLPDGSGQELAVKAARFGIKTVMMTGHPEVIEAMTTAGIIYLRKHFDSLNSARLSTITSARMNEGRATNGR